MVAVFVTYRKELGFPILEMIRPQFPDATVLLKLGNKYIKKCIEFEFKSSGFKKHLSELSGKKKCHYVVCWEHDWKNCPVSVIELRTKIKEILKLRQI